MKIQELLDNLLHKKLGRDVRQSIHDSIEQCYKDATGHPDSVAAVIKENKEMQEQLDSNINTINGRIDTILTGAVNTTKLVTVHSATIRNNSASDLTFKISSKDNETLKSIKDKSPTVINANVIAKALDGVAINGKGIPSSYNVESTNDEYVITVYSGSSSVVGQYVFMAVVTIAYEDIATDISSAELKDVRAGADGTVYKSAGEAVRQQIGSLKESINDLKSSGANNESLIVIYDILSKGTYTEDISSLMSQLDGLVHDGMYKITSDVKNATLSNKSNYVAKGSKYTCTVTASLGYKISAVVVTMGGVNISSNYDTTTKTITIESVTGPINITITTIETDYTSLQYIKGDGNSWIDTGVVANVNHRYELSAKLDGDDADEYFFGADQFNVGSAYNQFYLIATANHMKIKGAINKNAGIDVGSWYTTENNLLSNKKMYLVVKNGSQEIYLNSDYTEKQANYVAGSISFGAQDTLPIIPLYLFHVNTTASTYPSNASGYKRSKITVYWLKIYDDTTNEMLHEFLPVAKNGKIGMLDTVTKEFHPNIGTGTFAYEEA